MAFLRSCRCEPTVLVCNVEGHACCWTAWGGHSTAVFAGGEEIPDGYFQSFHSDLLGRPNRWHLIQMFNIRPNICKGLKKFLILLFLQVAGKLLNHLSHSLVSRGFLGNNEHAGFVYVRPTFQSLEGLPLPAPPFLFGLLMLRAEVPWAKAFPLRLMLRLGALPLEPHRLSFFSVL